MGSYRLLGLTTLLLSSLAALAAKSPGQLTPETFHSSVIGDAGSKSGTWFVEFFSPYCIHCTQFAPTWKQLVEEAETEIPGVTLAQVDCVMHGDLCDKNGITGWPTMFLFKDGIKIEMFKGSRSMENLKAFLIKHAPAPSTEHKGGDHAHDEFDEGSHEDDVNHEHEHDDDDAHPELHHDAGGAHHTGDELNPSGTVTVLTTANYASTLAKGPTFVKFYAPWCGHCKKLAPIWSQLAQVTKGKTQIAEVNCDEEGALCKKENIKGYPTLIYFVPGGTREEYAGGRKLDQMRVFVDKATSDRVHALSSPAELTQRVQKEQVVYLLLHPAQEADASWATALVRREAGALLNTPEIYASSAAALKSKYRIPETAPFALLAFKDGDVSQPTAKLVAPPTSSGGKGAAKGVSGEEVRVWLAENKLPGVLELTQDTFQAVMNAKHKPLVVLAGIDGSERQKTLVTETLREINARWRTRTGGSGKVWGGGGGGAAGKEVVFTYMDGQRWGEWVKSMYGMKIKAKKASDDEEELEDVPVVVVNHQDLVFYDQDMSGKEFKLVKPDRLFKALEDIVDGKLGYKNSENLIERFARTVNAKMMSFENYVVEYPLRFVFFLVVGLGVVLWVLVKWIGDDTGAGGLRGEHRKGRID